jgi:hypothetical protein
VEASRRYGELEGLRGARQAAGSPFLTMDSWQLDREELDDIITRLSNATSPMTTT